MRSSDGRKSYNVCRVAVLDGTRRHLGSRDGQRELPSAGASHSQSNRQSALSDHTDSRRMLDADSSFAKVVRVVIHSIGLAGGMRLRNMSNCI